MNLNSLFLNKNWYRKYPLRASSEYKDINGNALPLSLFAGANFSVHLPYINVFISKIFIQNNYINVTVSSRLRTGDISIGYFHATITQSNQILSLLPSQNWAAGSLVIGDASILPDLTGVYFFSYENGRIEDSLIFGYNPPAVAEFTNNNKNVSGFVTFALTNLEQNIVEEDISFTVVDKNLTTPDFFRTVGTLSCLNPIITGINSVVPDAHGNIDLFAIEPLEFQIDTGASKISLVIPDETVREDMCNAGEVVPALFAVNYYKGYRTTGDVNERDPLKTDIPEWDDKYPSTDYVWPTRKGAI